MSEPTTPLPSSEKLEKLNYYRSENRHEWNLLSNRTSAYITSQSFLVSAYTISMGNPNPRFTLYLPLLLSVVGLMLSLFSYPGIIGARRVIVLWHKKQSRLYLLNPEEAEKNPEAAQHDPLMEDFRDGRPYVPSRHANGEPVDAVLQKSLLFSVAMPWIFGATWIALAALSLFLHLPLKLK